MNLARYAVENFIRQRALDERGVHAIRVRFAGEFAQRHFHAWAKSH
ncbi:hypothetical protein Thpro_021320 [Acidihalobacter prosperus]|uniref:Uncharacterized protein n=1 Tax=Acidihalobacter prosperus TaxID=160660 RepID=A0A1A6C6U8_9GAMM|nr:hypothetical protein Thpro_021320 [Acidihalobacter prosperus]